MNLPEVSVIVPTYQRAAVLPHLFDALARQEYPADRTELIVVDNSSTDGTPGVVVDWRPRLPFAMHYFRRTNRGPAASRNYAAARATGEILAFTDSDCVPDHRWLRAGVDAFAEGVGLVCGPIIPLRRSDEPGVLFAGLSPHLSENGLYPTANLFVRRQLFDQVGGFDESFGRLPWGDLVGGEDTEFAWRVKRTGVTTRFVPEAAVSHLSSRLSFREWVLRPFRLQVVPRLLRTVPELRRTQLCMGYFSSAEHGYFQLFWLALLSSAIIRSPLPLPLTLPYLISTRRIALDRIEAGKPLNAIAALSLTILRHALETLVLALSSVRYRRVVL